MPFVTVSRRWFGGQDDAVWSRTFDAVEVEDHTFETEVTDNPVETGVSISDHAFDHPTKLSITAAVSDVAPPGKTNDTYATEGPTRGLAAYAWLRRSQRAHEPFSVQTGLDLFPSMMITSLRVKKDAAHEHILYFTVELKEVIWVTTEVVLYPAKAKRRAAAKKKDDGEHGSEESDETMKKKVRRTLLKQVVNFVSGGGG